LAADHLAGAVLLVARGAAVDAKDGRGRTPLNMAAARGHLDMVTLLLDRGANPRLLLVGTRTAGEVGSKTLVWLPDGAGLLVRTARIVSPRGVDLDGNGVTPDVSQELTLDDVERGLDSQLLRAIATASQK
jgi:ankyrin repeat protein